MSRIENVSNNGHTITKCTTKDEILKRMSEIDDSAIMQDATGLPQSYICKKEAISCTVMLEDGNIIYNTIELAKVKKSDKDRVLTLVNVYVKDDVTNETYEAGVKVSKAQVKVILEQVESNPQLQLECKFTRSNEKYNRSGDKVKADNPDSDYYFRFYGKCLLKVEGNTTAQQTRTAQAEQTV